MLITTSFASVFTGTGLAIAKFFFPNSSPVLHREVVYQGDLQRTPSGFILTLPNSELYTLRPKSNTSVNFKSLSNGLVLVKGNLTKEKFVIEASEITSLDSSPQITPPIPSNPPDPISSPSSSELPRLYPSLDWQTTQKRVLIFTSGKRKIEQEGVYLESAQISAFPQDFINYYLGEFKDRGFKETLNSVDPEGITITYAKDDLFLTFGTKNIYQGKADQKQLTGYKAFIEHN
ncbi:hypothetical protein HYW41_04540 [Candidatus Daviesbacteria bacterium]|nr:hypothetical protein [Candidatus Daviesbacteria bacterium]